VPRPLPALAALLLALGCGASSSGPAEPQGTTPIAGWEGKLTTYPLASTIPGIGSRNVTVLVPPGYADAASAATRYPVLVMHDGQNCLDHDGFGHGGWHVHTTVYDLVGRGLMAPAIVVLVDNSTTYRAQEYVPGLGTAPGPSAEGYLDFLEADVIPFVERHYRTRAGAASRGIGGSSYGGLISLYAAWTRPATWGFAMGMSTAYAYDLHALVRATVTRPPLRIYLDSGTRDYSGGDDGMAATVALRDLLVSKGFVLGTDLMHVVGQGDTHDESYWRARLPGALPFLLPP
jgi:enterochelin esterase-like enzyme